MKLIRRTVIILCILFMMNISLVYHLAGQGSVSLTGRFFSRFFILLILPLCYVFIEFIPSYEKGFKMRLQVLQGGYELIITSIYCLLLEVTGYLLYLFHVGGIHELPKDDLVLMIMNGILAYIFLLLHYLNGFFRTAFCSGQLGITLRLLMLFFWWLPPVNIFLFIKWCHIVKRELIYEKHQYLLNETRVENEICKTRYPVIMVHGIFFRDWQYLNYWGRIPKELKKNGGNVYYGKQQSSLSVADSAVELKEQILHVLHTTTAEKVNIIAHSKGGLDARYAISKLRMSEYVASLTTINTPHRGCQFVDDLLARLPSWLICFVSDRYNAIFQKLGDSSPDFLAGVKDLTAASCALFNLNVPDVPGVMYQSSMSMMHSASSACFPQNIGYLLVRKHEGDNDGLVAVSSAVWGQYTGLLTAKKKGVSHGDMIDLTHKNIKGFNVCESYVQLLASLKEKGF